MSLEFWARRKLEKHNLFFYNLENGVQGLYSFLLHPKISTLNPQPCKPSTDRRIQRFGGLGPPA